MIVDFNESGFPGQFHTDICIIGSGAAGITIARELLNIAGDIYYESAEDSPIQTAKRIEPSRERGRANDVSEATVACS